EHRQDRRHGPQRDRQGAGRHRRHRRGLALPGGGHGPSGGRPGPGSLWRREGWRAGRGAAGQLDGRAAAGPGPACGRRHRLRAGQPDDLRIVAPLV
ncbi:MAG: hypothetical protein AVDCRST_MAG27-1677, partial [uncultured Craurococcus sp.]